LFKNEIYNLNIILMKNYRLIKSTSQKIIISKNLVSQIILKIHRLAKSVNQSIAFN